MDEQEIDRQKLLWTLYDRPNDWDMLARYCDFMLERDLLPEHAARVHEFIVRGKVDLTKYATVVRGPVIRAATDSSIEYKSLRDSRHVPGTTEHAANTHGNFFFPLGYQRSVVYVDTSNRVGKAGIVAGLSYPVGSVFYIENGLISFVFTGYQTWIKYGRIWCHENPVKYVQLKVNNSILGTHPICRFSSPPDRSLYETVWKANPHFRELSITSQAKNKPKKRKDLKTEDEALDELSAALIEWARYGTEYELTPHILE